MYHEPKFDESNSSFSFDFDLNYHNWPTTPDATTRNTTFSNRSLSPPPSSSSSSMMKRSPAGNVSSDLNAKSSVTTESGDQQQQQQQPQSPYKRPFMLPPYLPIGGSSNSSPSAATASPNYLHQHHHSLGIRPPPPSPQTPTISPAAFGMHYPHYMLPPSLYAAYFQNSTAPTAAGQLFSPTSGGGSGGSLVPLNSPISPFLVPNIPQSVSPSSSSANVNVDHFSLQQNHSSAFHPLDESNTNVDADILRKNIDASIRNLSSNTHVIDLTPDRQSEGRNSANGVKVSHNLTATTSIATNTTNSTNDIAKNNMLENKNDSSSGNNLKRKSPVAESTEIRTETTTQRLSDSSRLSPFVDTGGGGGDAEGNLISRKHRISKLPNINIASESDLRHNFASSFLHSPLLGTHPLGGHMPSSPFAYLEPIPVPLSAPPTAPPHLHAHSKFDFSAYPDVFPSPHRFPLLSSSATLSPSNKEVSSLPFNNNQFGSNNPFPSVSFLTKDTISKSPSSIMKDAGKKKSCNNNNNNGNHSNESKVTFQVPYVHKTTTDHQDMKRHKDKNSHSKSGKKINGSNNRSKHHHQQQQQQQQQCQKYPEYFRRGSTIVLDNGCLKKVEELSTEDFIESATANGKFKLELSEIFAITEKAHKGSVRITFLVGEMRANVLLDCPAEHPFFVFQKGWSSCAPAVSAKRYGLNCHRLNLGDIVVTLANKSPPSQSATNSSQLLSSQKLPPSLASSSGSLSSASSSSSSSSPPSSSVPMINHCASSSFSSRSAATHSTRQSPRPPPAHNCQTSHKDLLHSSAAVDSALNLDTKFGIASRAANKPRTKHQRSAVAKDEDDEEIDVERVDDEDKLTNNC